jgi:hypothetical protein
MLPALSVSHGSPQVLIEGSAARVISCGRKIHGS